MQDKDKLFEKYKQDMMAFGITRPDFKKAIDEYTGSCDNCVEKPYCLESHWMKFCSKFDEGII